MSPNIEIHLGIATPNSVLHENEKMSTEIVVNASGLVKSCEKGDEQSSDTQNSVTFLTLEGALLAKNQGVSLAKSPRAEIHGDLIFPPKQEKKVLPQILPQIEGKVDHSVATNFQNVLQEKGFTENQVQTILLALQAAFATTETKIPVISLDPIEDIEVDIPITITKTEEKIPQVIKITPVTEPAIFPTLPTTLAVIETPRRTEKLPDVTDIYMLLAEGNIEKAAAVLTTLQAANVKIADEKLPRLVAAYQIKNKYQKEYEQLPGFLDFVVSENDDGAYYLEMMVAEGISLNGHAKESLEGLPVKITFKQTIAQYRAIKVATATQV